jgi:hypothetical protein
MDAPAARAKAAVNANTEGNGVDGGLIRDREVVLLFFYTALVGASVFMGRTF